MNAATGLFFSGEIGIMPTTVKFKYENAIPDYKYSEMGFLHFFAPVHTLL